MKKITVIMPCYNEAAGIKEHAAMMQRYLESMKHSYEIILVDDGSTDATAKIIDGLVAKNASIIALHHDRNRGRGAALRTGFERASGEYIFTFDADLTYSPEHLAPMLAELERGADIVMGSPYHKKGTVKNVPWFRLLVSKLGNKVLTIGSPFTVMTCVLRGYRRKVIDSLVLFSEGKEIHLEVLSKAQDLNFRIVEVPAHLHWHAKAGRSAGRRSTFKLVSQSIVHLQYLFSETPFILLGTLASVLIIAGLAIGGFIISEWLKHQLVPDRPLITLMMLFLIAGLLTLLFSMIANQNRSLRRDIVQTQSLLKKK